MGFSSICTIENTTPSILLSTTLTRPYWYIYIGA